MTGPAPAPGHAPPPPWSPLGLAVMAIALALDQASKWAVAAWLAEDRVIELLPILALYRTHNTGIAFSLFAGYGSGLLVAGAVAITLLVLVFWARSREGGRLAAVGFALIIGGALGNLADRITVGHVVDFLLLHIGERTLFVFNLADVALTLGPIALVVAFLRPGRRPPAPGDRPPLR